MLLYKHLKHIIICVYFSILSYSFDLFNHTNYNNSKLPIVYVYTVVPVVCKYGLPQYIKTSLIQALLTQPDCDVVMASNFKECPNIMKTIENIPNLLVIDVTSISSNRTYEFQHLAKDIFQSDRSGELWITSALRFFHMEDIMINMNYTEMLHIEADNMIYGRMTTILELLRKGYKGLAATPLTANRSFITASVFWISSLRELQLFSDFLYNIASHKTYQAYLSWLRPFACCKKNGIDPDANNNGIKPFAINEMSMLAYYHHLYPTHFHLFPVVPHQLYNLNRHVVNMSEFGPYGSHVGPDTLNGIWDPNSWGQRIGGTSSGRGRDKGFRDFTHIIGQAIGTTGCNISMLCSPQDNADIMNDIIKNVVPNYITNYNITSQCLTAPYVRCNGGDNTRLWNLHVHSKHTQDYLSKPCECSTAI